MKIHKKMFLFLCISLVSLPLFSFFGGDYPASGALTGAAIGGLAGGRRGAGIGLGVGAFSDIMGSAARASHRRRYHDDDYHDRSYRARRAWKQRQRDLEYENEQLRQQLQQYQNNMPLE